MTVLDRESLVLTSGIRAAANSLAGPLRPSSLCSFPIRYGLSVRPAYHTIGGRHVSRTRPRKTSAEIFTDGSRYERYLIQRRPKLSGHEQPIPRRVIRD